MLGIRCEPADLGGWSWSWSASRSSCSSMELRSSDCDLEGWYSGASSLTEGLRAYEVRFRRTPRECDGRLAVAAASSRRNMLDNVVRDRCSADGRDGPASLVEEGRVEECNKRESLLVLLERIGGRRRVGALKRSPPSSLFACCESCPRSRSANDDCRRRCVLLPSTADAEGWSLLRRGCEAP
jgi:hypothetical protein